MRLKTTKGPRLRPAGLGRPRAARVIFPPLSKALFLSLASHLPLTRSSLSDCLGTPAAGCSIGLILKHVLLRLLNPRRWCLLPWGYEACIIGYIPYRQGPYMSLSYST